MIQSIVLVGSIELNVVVYNSLTMLCVDMLRLCMSDLASTARYALGISCLCAQHTRNAHDLK